MTAISQSEFMQALGWAILNSLWQMALLWILFQGITALFKIEKPSHKTALATTLLLTGFAWFIFTFVSIWTKTYEGTITATVISGIASDERLYNWLHTTLPIASVVYLVLLILPTLQFIRNYRFVQVIRTQGLKKIEVDWRIFVKKVAARMGIKKPVHIWISDMISSPVTVGYLKPVILVPIAAINHLTPQQLEAVLLHELSHIRRYDYLINLLINFIQTILYFNPFVKSFVKIIEREREKSCDEMVVQFQYDPHGYASALLILEKENHSSRPLAVAASGKKNDLVQRIELILGIHKKSVLSFNRLAGLMAGLLCIIGLNAVLIFAKPSAVDHPKNSLAFNNFSSPFFYLTGNELNREQELPKQNTINQIADRTQQQEKKISENKIKTVVQNNDPLFVVAPDESKKAAPLFLNVNYHPAIEIPKLKAYQQAQINDALAKSKEVLQEGQWKALEKNIADALTSDEKGQLKKVYVKEFSKLNLEKWKDKLTLAYDKIDWERINEQLGKAVYDIKLDSLQMLYSDAAINLENLEQQLHETNQKGIPDSDITLKLIEEHKAEVQKMLNTIKAIRNKKIIHL
ncbi:MAG TPA: M56 family metallopeptidase [Chitinophagaceae bacterium]|jgi:beta-lactamase regulating signal transducer with metallopeptidase domain|nr:M56 family metallopeptidase [Chitinophagaceae bacterium]